MAQRRTLLLTTYFQLGQAKQAVDVAKQILANDPNDFSALYITVTLTQSLAGQSPTPDVLDQGEKAATALLNINTAPPNLTADQWTTQKPQVQNLALTTLGWIALQKKNWQAAQTNFQKSLQIDPNNGTIDFQLATAIYSEKDPAKTPTALFYFARAATYEGQGALNPDGRKTVMTYVQKAYKGYHGSDEGFNNLLAAAKASPTPPADFTIKNALDIAKAEMANEEEWTKAHPQEAMWKGIKEALTGADGANYFDSSMKDAQLPPLKGKVVKLEPATRPKTIAPGHGRRQVRRHHRRRDVEIRDGAAWNRRARHRIDIRRRTGELHCQPADGGLQCRERKLHGWTGKNAPPVHRAAPKKSASK